MVDFFVSGITEVFKKMAISFELHLNHFRPHLNKPDHDKSWFVLTKLILILYEIWLSAALPGAAWLVSPEL